MQGMCRKADSNNVVLLVVLLEYSGQVTLIAIQDNYLPTALLLGFGMLVEVLDPIQASFVICLAIC